LQPTTSALRRRLRCVLNKERAMIFEMRTYLLKPGTEPKAEELFGEMMPGRAKLSRIAGFWRTEVGTLNQIIHIWPYENIAERDRIRAEAIKTGVWPPKVADL